MLKAYKYAIYPTEDQRQKLSMFFGSCRFIYNLGLETKRNAWASARKNLTYIELAKQMKELKDSKEAEWLKKCPAQSLQMALRNLDNAYGAFFRGGVFPKFKSRNSKQSIQFPQDVKVDFKNGRILLPKLKWTTCIFHRQFSGNIKTVTVSKTTTGKYFVSILVDNQKELPKKFPAKRETVVGIDMGIKTFATLSDGTAFENPKYLRRNISRLKVQQRKLNRRFRPGLKEQSKGYKKQKLIVAKLHEHIRNQRNDYLQKTSTRIIRSYDTICLEDLNISGMMQNDNLALSIGEIGWYTFKTMLEYKAEWYGKNILFVGRFEPSSKTCSVCQYIFKELSLKDRSWTCNSCGTKHDRDINAAINIMNFGLRKQPSTVNVSQ